MWHNASKIGTNYGIIHVHKIVIHRSTISSVASSSSVLTDSSHKLNVSEGEEKPTSAPTILDRLKAPKVLDFARKRKVAVNSAPCGIGMCKSTNKKKLS